MITSNRHCWRAFFSCLFFAIGFSFFSHARSQTATQPTKLNITLPAGASTKKADEFLATLRPATSFSALESGNDLLLEFPDVAIAGGIRIKIISAMPNTDGMWLLSLSPQPDGGNTLLAALTLTQSSLPEATLLLNLFKTQSILLVVRSGGKYYGLQREIKIGTPSSAPVKK